MIHITANRAKWTEGDVSLSVAYSHPESDEFGTRAAWEYAIQVGDLVHGGRDLYGPYTGEHDPAGQLAALISFLASDGEKYRRLMGPAPEDEEDYLFPLWLAEWAYLNEDELSLVSLELPELSDDEAD